MRTGAWPGCLRSPSGEFKVHRCGEEALRGRILTDEGLPLASSARVTSELRGGLETKLAVERGLDLTLVAAGSGEERTTKLGLNEELGVKELGSRVEGGSRDGGVDVVGRRDGVRSQERNNLSSGEATSIGEAGKDGVDGVEGLRHGQVGRGLGRISTADEDIELRSTGAVAEPDGAGELDAVQVVSLSLAAKESPLTSRRW